MIEYKLHKDSDNEIITCDSCSCDVATHPFDWGPPYSEEHDTKERHLCEFCASSYVGNLTRSRSLDTEGYLRQEMAILIAQATNYLSGKLGK